jgi:pyridoxine 4-dehydrogenase
MKKELSYRTDPWFPQSVGAPRHRDNLTRVDSSSPAAAAGAWRLGDLTVNRLGFGAMRLTGSLPFAKGSPSDRGQSIAVLRRAVELGVNHIDTAAFYFSPLRSANELINAALAPYPGDLVITTKVGPGRTPGANGTRPAPTSWAARSRRTCDSAADRARRLRAEPVRIRPARARPGAARLRRARHRVRALLRDRGPVPAERAAAALRLSPEDLSELDATA